MDIAVAVDNVEEGERSRLHQDVVVAVQDNILVGVLVVGILGSAAFDLAVHLDSLTNSFFHCTFLLSDENKVK